MIYNTRNQNSDTTESQKEKRSVLTLIFSTVSQSKIMGNKGVYSLNKMWSLKSLTQLRCESRTSLHAVQYK